MLKIPLFTEEFCIQKHFHNENHLQFILLIFRFKVELYEKILTCAGNISPYEAMNLQFSVIAQIIYIYLFSEKNGGFYFCDSWEILKTRTINDESKKKGVI